MNGTSDNMRPDDGQETDLTTAARQWWRTGIIDIQPGSIRIKGTPIETLIGTISFPEMIWRMLRDDRPTPAQLRLFEAALVSSVDHGPQAPSIAIARMAVTCGVNLNGAMASGVNVLDDIHGGAGEQCLALYRDAVERMQGGADAHRAADEALRSFQSHHGSIIPGFGHRFHPVDPRAVRLTALAAEAAAQHQIEGCFLDVATTMQSLLVTRNGRTIPMNIDGATAVIYGELGFPDALARGLFVLSRSVGILAHAWEQKQQGGRIKGPLPPSLGYTYTGPGPDPAA
ncbi:citryl-CoA lyase [Castellaniella sp.]|uniref:citryl-CoA lyase n=1 Tax=Castellaniella sp. TaxID=1955812 RepID=UPI003A4D595F